MKLGALLEYLRNRGIRLKQSNLSAAIRDGRISRPPRDTDGRYDYGAANVEEIVALWGKKKG